MEQNHIIAALEDMDSKLGGKSTKNEKKSKDEFMNIKNKIPQKVRECR